MVVIWYYRTKTDLNPCLCQMPHSKALGFNLSKDLLVRLTGDYEVAPWCDNTCLGCLYHTSHPVSGIESVELDRVEPKIKKPLCIKYMKSVEIM